MLWLKYSSSEAFEKAWRRVKLTMTIRAAGTTFENRQERLNFLKNFKPEDLTVTLEREADNQHDKNAIRITVHILPIKKRTVIGYVPAGLARELATLIGASNPAIVKLVYTQKGVKSVMVAAVEEYRPQGHPEWFRTVIRKRGTGGRPDAGSG